MVKFYYVLKHNDEVITGFVEANTVREAFILVAMSLPVILTPHFTWAIRVFPQTKFNRDNYIC